MSPLPSDLLDPLPHAQALIRCPSVTPDQAGALDYMERVLAGAGFTCRRLKFVSPGEPEIDNLYARIGRAGPHLCFAGHVDVVPPGEEAAWRHPPFAAMIEDGVLYGRGAADMKGGIAAMMAAALRWRAAGGGGEAGSLSFLITADEEGRAVNGTRKVVAWMRENGETPDHCILGEPTNETDLGETIKIGRRGSLNGRLTVTGVQGHVAYPYLANNPLTGLVAVLKRYLDEVWDEGSDNFVPSNLEVTSIDTGNPTVNIIPARTSARFNIRFNDRQTKETLRQRLTAIADSVLEPTGLTFLLELDCSGEAFLTEPGGWVAMLAEAIGEVAGRTPELSTSGGTSDARFIKDICPVVEFGLVNRTIHQVNEQVPVTHLRELTAEGRAFAVSAGRLIAEAGLTLCSGGAIGADLAAQETCLTHGGSAVIFPAGPLTDCPAQARTLYLAEQAFDAPFSAARALTRNRYLHAMGEKTLVAQCTRCTGGTWEGAIENLRRGYSPVFVHADGTEGAQALLARGASPVTELHDLDELQPAQLRF